MTGDSVDAVVIGAGHNGLVAANLLADAGLGRGRAGGDRIARRRGAVGRGHRARLPQRPVQLVLPARLRLAGAAPRCGLERARPALAARPGRAGPPAAGRARRACSTATRTAPRRRWTSSPPATAQAMAVRVRGMAAASRPAAGRAVHAVPAGARRVRPCCGSSAWPARCGWPAGSCCPPGSSAASCSHGEGAQLLLAGCALHTDLSPDEAGQRRVRLAARDARASSSAGRCRSAARSGSPTRWSPGCSPGAAGSATARRSTGSSWPAAGRWARSRPAAAPGGPAARCWPTCRRRRSTSTWSGPARLPPRLRRGPGPLPLGRRHGQGRLGAVGARCRGRTRPSPGAGTVHLGADLDGLTQYAADAGLRRGARATRSCSSAR